MKRLVCLALAAGLAQGSGPDRRRAVEHGLQFIYSTARDEKNFSEFCEDYLWCFYSLSAASRDAALAKVALGMGQERAAVWLRDIASHAPVSRADQLADLAFGAYAAERLGYPDANLKERIRKAALLFPVTAYLRFDPLQEPPPADIPELCGKCSRQNPRGATVCQRCGTHLTMRSRYGVWCDALITTYFGDRYGVTLGAPYSRVIWWLPAMRPYRGNDGGANAEFYDTIYALTHVVYTLDDYSQRRVSLPYELTFLKSNVKEALALHDSEMLGEFLDSLKALGLKDRDRLIRTGVGYLLATQNPDGSWGDPHATDMYERYHPTWTAIGGLMRYKWEHH